MGKVIREKIKIAFDSKEPVKFDSEVCNQQYKALSRLADNTHRNKYKRTRNSSATGLSTDECNIVLSTEALKLLEEENKGFFQKYLYKKNDA